MQLDRFINKFLFTFRHTKSTPSISYSENPLARRPPLDQRKRKESTKGDDKVNKESEKKKKSEKSSKDSKDSSKKSNAKVAEACSKESQDLTNKKPSQKEKPEVEVKSDDNIEKDVKTEKSNEKSPQKSPTKLKQLLKLVKTPEKLEEKSPKKKLNTPTDKVSKSPIGKSQENEKNSQESSIKTPDKLSNNFIKSPDKISTLNDKLDTPDRIKVELIIERKKSPKRIEKPKVNIFLEDSDEVDEFESIATVVKSRWSSPEVFKVEGTIPKVVPAPNVEHKRMGTEVPVVIESPERSPINPVPLTENNFELSSVTIEKSPTPSPPLRPARAVRNVCSFLSDIASGNMFSGLGLGSGLYDDSSSSSKIGLNLDDLKVDTNVKLMDCMKLARNIMPESDNVMEPDTTADKSIEKVVEKSLTTPSESDSDDSDSDTSSSSDSDSDDTTSESEESSEESSDDEIPSFTRGFGRFDASTMPMVTQIKPTIETVTPTPAAVSRFQPQQSIIKPPGLLTNVTKPTYTPSSAQQMPTVSSLFSITPGFQFPIPFKIYSLRETNNCEIIYPGLQPVAAPPPVVTTPVASEKDKKSSDRRDKDRKRSRSHSRDRDKKRLKDDRRKTPPRRRSLSPNKKRHSDDRGRQTEERKDSRRRDLSPRHSSSHTSRASYGSR